MNHEVRLQKIEETLETKVAMKSDLEIIYNKLDYIIGWFVDYERDNLV